MAAVVSSAGDGPVVEFRNVSVRVPGRDPIVSRLDLTVQRGEILVLLGRSGSGKTTTLKLTNRLLQPSEGTVIVEGRSTADWDAVSLRRRIGYVIQEVGLFPHLSIARNVGLVPRLEGWGAERAGRRVEELLSMVGLEPEAFAHRYPSQLSGGQRQRVGVARALAADPPLLLLDEPFGALDPLTRLELQDELKRLQQHLTKTMIFVTHDVREGLFLADRIALLTEGSLAFLGSPGEFLDSSQPEVAAFIRALREPAIERPPS